MFDPVAFGVTLIVRTASVLAVNVVVRRHVKILPPPTVQVLKPPPLLELNVNCAGRLSVRVIVPVVCPAPAAL